MKISKEGDLFKLQTEKGIAYLQLIKNPVDNSEVELIKVYLTIFAKEISDFTMIRKSESFFVQFALKSAIRKQIVEKVGSLELTEKDNPPKQFRTENVFGDGWQIVDSETWNRETVRELTKEQIELSPWGIMNDTRIKELIDQDWTLNKWK